MCYDYAAIATNWKGLTYCFVIGINIKEHFKLILKTYKGLRNTILLVVTYYNKSNSLQIIVVPSWKPKIVYQCRSGHTNIVNKVVCYFGSRYNTFCFTSFFIIEFTLS